MLTGTNKFYVDADHVSSSSSLLLLLYYLKLTENSYLNFGQNFNKKISKENVETSSLPFILVTFTSVFFSSESWLVISSYLCTTVKLFFYLFSKIDIII